MGSACTVVQQDGLQIGDKVSGRLLHSLAACLDD
jgi:hypothetical protein